MTMTRLTVPAPTDHNPAFPDRRRYLARVVLLAGTALHLDLPDAVAVQAERDAATLRRVHRSRDRALWRTRPATT